MIRNNRIKRFVLTLYAHFDNFFISSSISKTFSSHINSRHIFKFHYYRPNKRFPYSYSYYKSLFISNSESNKINFIRWSWRNMLIYLIIKIISLIISLFTFKSNKFISFIINSNIHSSTISISKTSYCFNPSFNIIPIQNLLTLYLPVLKYRIIQKLF